jgi:hypothetical protein
MRFIKQFENYHEKDQISEGLSYHVKNSIPLMESVYRIESDAWISLINEARDMWEREVLDLCEDDLFLISTDAGKFGIFEGKKVLLDIPFFEGEEDLHEAEYRGRKVNLNKPFRTPQGPRKFAVYTKNEKGNVIKLGFGEPGMRVNNADPEKARSFQKRMRCHEPGPRWKAKWWSCNVARYRKLLGIKSSNPW